MMSEKSSLQDLSGDSIESSFPVKNSFPHHVFDLSSLSSSDDSGTIEDGDSQDSFSDSSSIIFIEEFTKCNGAESPNKKIKLETEKDVVNSSSTVLPDIQLDSSTSFFESKSKPESRNSLSPLKSEKRKRDEDIGSPTSALSNIKKDHSNSFDSGLKTSEMKISLLSPSCTVPKCEEEEPTSEKTQESCTMKFTSIKRLTRDDLELVITKQMVDVITANERISALEEKLDATEKLLELSQDKTMKLAREVTTLDLVLKKIMSQVKNGNAKIVRPPKKILRSVGIQVRQEAIVKRPSKTAIDSKVTNAIPAENSINTLEKTSIISENREGKSVSETVPPNLPASQSLSKSASKSSAGQMLTIEDELTIANNKSETAVITDPFPPLPEASAGSLTADPLWKLPPPKLELRISKVAHNLHFCWNTQSSQHAEVEAYRIWGYSRSSYPSRKWEQLAEFPSDRLPMSCLIDATKLAEQCKTPELCFFIIRATDVYGRDGPWSDPASVTFP